MQRFSLWLLVLCCLLGLSTNATTKKATKRSKAQAIFKAKCMDCHSDKTVYPWYYQMPGAKQLMDADIQKGKAFFHLENELFAVKDDKDIPKSIITRLNTVINTDSMPPIQYKIAHWDKILSAQDKKIITAWLNSIASTGSDSEPIEALPQLSELELDANKVALGKILYHDKRLSTDSTVSCASCHDLTKGGTDQKAFSSGVRSQLGNINSPTTLNAVYNVQQFWDGRAKDLEAQAHGPVLNQAEMGCASWDEVIGRLSKDTLLVAKFKKVYNIKSGDQITGNMIANSVAEFEKSLITPNNRFDKYLKGNKDALTDAEIKGYELFKKYNCTACHNGPAVGGGSFQKMGLVKDYFADRASGLNDLKKLAQSEADNGRYNFTEKIEDKGKFKTPILRNIALTYPYMHDGNVASLEEAVRIMGEYQVGVKIPKQDIDLIVKFLKTL